MRYLLCLLPPVAVLSTGKPILFALSIILTLLGYIPGVIFALFIVSNYNADKRTDRVVKAMQQAK